MDYLGESAGLTSEQTDKVLQFQDLTGIEDITICRDVLQRHQWNLEVAVQEQLNIREGRPSIYATESRPPAIINDHHGQHIYHTPPTDGSGSGFRGLFQNLFNLVLNLCYNTLVTVLQITRRLLGLEYRPRIDPVHEVLEFIKTYEEKYPHIEHPVFYQGTFSQVLNDAKHELRFLLVYLHDPDVSDTDQFCTGTLSSAPVINYINQHFLFWGCSAKSEEGRRCVSSLRSSYYPFLAVLVLRDNRMTLVGRLEGYSDPDLLVQRLTTIVAEFGISLVQARQERVENNFNRSLRAYQDQAFQESLRIDQEKERKRELARVQAEAERRRLEAEERAEEERRESIAREKIESVVKVPDEPDPTNPDTIHVVLKLPNGSRLERRFLKTHSLEAVFYFVFCHPLSPDSFEITTSFPCRVLKCRPADAKERIQTLQEAGLQKRELLFINDLDA